MPEGVARRKALRELGRALGLSETARGDCGMLDLALTHDSYAHERGARRGERSNERLEFLGDAVIGLAAARWLTARFPAEAEGRLSRRRQSLVSRLALAGSAERVGLGPLVLVGKGEAKHTAALRPSILAGAFEAVAGAAFVCEGFDAAAKFIERMHFAHAPVTSSADARTELQELSQARFGRAPAYSVTGESGPAHARVFTARVSAGGVVGTGSGPTKKHAQAEAAAQALLKLRPA